MLVMDSQKFEQQVTFNLLRNQAIFAISYWYCKLNISPYRPPKKPAFFRSSLHIFFDRRQNLVQALPSFARRGRVFGRNWSQICFESHQNIWCQFFGSNSLGKSKLYNSSKKTSLVEENESRKIYQVCISRIFVFMGKFLGWFCEGLLI